MVECRWYAWKAFFSGRRCSINIGEVFLVRKIEKIIRERSGLDWILVDFVTAKRLNGARLVCACKQLCCNGPKNLNKNGRRLGNTDLICLYDALLTFSSSSSFLRSDTYYAT